MYFVEEIRRTRNLSQQRDGSCNDLFRLHKAMLAQRTDTPLRLRDRALSAIFSFIIAANSPPLPQLQ